MFASKSPYELKRARRRTSRHARACLTMIAAVGLAGPAAPAGAVVTGGAVNTGRAPAGGDAARGSGPEARVLLDLVAREEETRAHALEPGVAVQRLALLEEIVEALEGTPPGPASDLVLYSAERLADELDRPAIRRELARYVYRSRLAEVPGPVDEARRTDAMYELRAELLVRGFNAARRAGFGPPAGSLPPGIRPHVADGEDTAIALRDLRAYIADWRIAPPAESPNGPVSRLLSVLESGAQFLRRTGHPAEATEVYRDITAYARWSDDPLVGRTFTPAYSTAMEAVAHLEAGNADGAAAAVDAIIAMPPEDRRMESTGVRSVAFYLSRVLSEHSFSDRTRIGDRTRIDLVLPWLERTGESLADPDVFRLITLVGFYGASQYDDADLARRVLAHVDRALDDRAALERMDGSMRAYLVSRGAGADGWVNKPETSGLLVSKFRLLRTIGDEDGAMRIAERILTEFPNTPSLDPVARWYRARMKEMGEMGEIREGSTP
jgi:hypothetical protein